MSIRITAIRTIHLSLLSWILIVFIKSHHLLLTLMNSMLLLRVVSISYSLEKLGSTTFGKDLPSLLHLLALMPIMLLNVIMKTSF